MRERERQTDRQKEREERAEEGDGCDALLEVGDGKLLSLALDQLAFVALADVLQLFCLAQLKLLLLELPRALLHRALRRGGTRDDFLSLSTLL